MPKVKLSNHQNSQKFMSNMSITENVKNLTTILCVKKNGCYKPIWEVEYSENEERALCKYNSKTQKIYPIETIKYDEKYPINIGDEIFVYRGIIMEKIIVKSVDLLVKDIYYCFADIRDGNIPMELISQMKPDVVYEIIFRQIVINGNYHTDKIFTKIC